MIKKYLAVVFFVVAICPELLCAADENFIVGVGAHVSQRKISANNLKSLLDAGQFNGFRDDISWGKLERIPGIFKMDNDLVELDSAIRMGGAKSRALLILDYGNQAYDGGRQPYSEAGRKAFSRYAEFVARSYGQNVYGFEIWNEWNIGAGNQKFQGRWGDPQNYVALVRETSPELRRLAPQAKIVCGAIADRDLKWLEAILKEGILAYCDAISIHPYVFSDGAKGEPLDAFVNVDASWQLIKKYDTSGGKIRILITELGWPNHSGKGGRNGDVVGAFVTQSFLMAKARPWISGMWWYELIDSGMDITEREHNFGLLTRNQLAKPAFSAIKAIAPILKDGVLISAGVLSGNRYWVKLALSNGEEATAFWVAGGGSATFRLQQIGSAGNLAVLTGRLPTFINGIAVVEVGQEPIVITHGRDSMMLM